MNKRPIAFTLVCTDQSTMIMNRNDYHNHIKNNPLETYGLGYQIFETGSFEQEEINIIEQILLYLKNKNNEQINVIDGGANIGVHTVNLAKFMNGWGNIIAMEAQERIYYALCGNITINNCFNAKAVHLAIHDNCGQINIPRLNYFIPSSYGSLEIIKRNNTENIGQNIDYDNNLDTINCITLDVLCEQTKIHFMKLDIEGMEINAINGAKKIISRDKPIFHIENCKCGHDNIQNVFKEFDYKVIKLGENTLCYPNDPDIDTFIQNIVKRNK